MVFMTFIAYNRRKLLLRNKFVCVLMADVLKITLKAEMFIFFLQYTINFINIVKCIQYYKRFVGIFDMMFKL